MFFDALTIAGLFSAASFLLMPLLMGREFFRVEMSDETELHTMRSEKAAQRPKQPAQLGLS